MNGRLRFPSLEGLGVGKDRAKWHKGIKVK